MQARDCKYVNARMCRLRLVQNMLGKTPEDIAEFLAKTSGLEKAVIGEYLGEREDMALAVMHAYVDAMDFGNSDFDAAIRHEALFCHQALFWQSWYRPGNERTLFVHADMAIDLDSTFVACRRQDWWLSHEGLAARLCLLVVLIVSLILKTVLEF